MAKRPTTPRQLSKRHATPFPKSAAELESLPIQHGQAAGIDVGDRSHWVAVSTTPDGSPTTREFPAHTPGLRQLIDWLRQCGVTTIALEASGAYGHVLFLTLLEAGFDALVTSPAFTRQIKGRPKTDRLDCQWILRLHSHGLLPPVCELARAVSAVQEDGREGEVECDAEGEESGGPVVASGGMGIDPGA
jgi:hypothetical protein